MNYLGQGMFAERFGISYEAMLMRMCYWKYYKGIFTEFCPYEISEDELYWYNWGRMIYGASGFVGG
jgi:hypothetical protein